MALIRKRPDPAAATVPDVEATSDSLHSASPDARRAAARLLAGDPANVAALSAALASETVTHVREAILTALAGTDVTAAAAAILPLVRSEDAAERTLALDALRTMTGTLPVVLPHILRDEDPDVRLLGSDLARSLPPDAATALLVPMLATETEANVCAAAVEVLSERGTGDALPALRAVAVRFAADPFLAFAVERAIERIGPQATTA